MNDPSMRNPAYLSLTDQQLSEIDELCDRFDRELMKGGAPQIENFLAKAPEAAQDGLLAELLAMEVEYRTQAGDTPAPIDYVQRFPQQVSLIASMLRSKSPQQLLETQFTGSDETLNPEDAIPGIPDITNFRLIKELGRGGMGVVWLAEQIQPVRRRVALKLIKSELRSKDVLARFDAEKQAVALMDHPNIARVLDAGSTSDGHPYFVMELVEGVPITQYCDDNKLSVDERLKLFVSVCKGVQHAHQKGIIHRDLKPSNVLVTVIDGEAVAKVIDFGLAKAVEQSMLLTDVTMQTEYGKVIGTVQYMSPEQAELKGLGTADVDTRTDVYSLLAIGAVLLAGIVGTSYGLVRSNEKTELAEHKTHEADEQRASAVKAEERAVAESLRARDSEASANFQLANARWNAARASEARDLLREMPSEYRDNFEWRFCNREFDGSDFTCYGHSMPVRDVAFSPDGTQIATASSDTTIKLWDAESGQEINTLWGNQGEVDKVVFSPDGTRIALMGSDKTIKIWEAGSGQAFVTLEGQKNSVAGIAFSPDGEQLVSVDIEATVQRWDLRTGRKVATFENHINVSNVAFSPDGQRFVSCGDNGSIILWDATTGKEIASQANAVRWPKSVAFSPDGMHIAAAGYDVVTLWNVELTQELWTGSAKAGWIHDLSFSPDGTRIASTAERDSQIRIWDAHSGLEIMALAGHGATVLGVTFSPDGTRLASFSYDNTLRRWDARTGQKAMSIRAHSTKVNGLAFSNDDTRLASVSKDGTFKLWDLATCLEIAIVNGVDKRPDESRCLAFSPNDAYVAFSGDDHSVRLLDGKTGAELKSFHGHESWICGVAFSPDNRNLVSGGNDQTVKLWSIDSGEEITTFTGHLGRVNSVAFSPDGRRVASASEDGTVKLWDTHSGREIKSLDGHGQNVFDVAFSPNGKQIASSGNDATIRIWDEQSGKVLSQMIGHSSGVIGGVFSPNGKRVATTAYDGSLKLWDTQTGREIVTVETSAHWEKNIAGSKNHNFAGVAFSPGGWRIAAGMDNGIIKFLDAPTEQEVETLRGHTGTLTQWSFSDDGNRVYSASENEKLCWDLATKKVDPDAVWDPPSKHTQVSPDGRWFINRDGNNLILVDLEYKNTTLEKRYRALKSRFDPWWHQEQATAATAAKNWYAATFHFALLMKHDPDQSAYYDGLQSSFQELKSQFQKQELDIEPHMAPFVKESLKLSRRNDVPNPSFEEPVIRKASFELRQTLPGWRTTGTLSEIWSTDFWGVKAHDGSQFVELNAKEDATLYRDVTGIERDAEIEFSFAHRGRNGDDTMKLTITDLGADNSVGGGDDQKLLTKDYTTGNDAWAVYDSTTEPKITALGNKVQFVFSAVHATGGRGPENTEGNFLDSAEFGVGVVTAKRETGSAK